MGGEGVYLYLASKTDMYGECTPLFIKLTKEELQHLYSAMSEGSFFLPFGDTFYHIDDIVKFKITKKEQPFRTV